MKKVLSAVLSVVVVLSLFPATVFAAEVGKVVDESVDKSTAKVVGELIIFDAANPDGKSIKTYASKTVHIDYNSNPETTEVKKMIETATNTLKKSIPANYDFEGTNISSTTSSFDNRLYSFVYDIEDQVLDQEVNQAIVKKYMHITGDYGKEVVYNVVVTASKCDHTMTKHPGSPATCTESGTKDSWECTKCGKTYLDANGKTLLKEDADLVIKALGHKPGKPEETLIIPPTVNSDGLKKVIIKCTRCGETISEEEVPIPAITYRTDKSNYSIAKNTKKPLQAKVIRSFENESTFMLHNVEKATLDGSTPVEAGWSDDESSQIAKFEGGATTFKSGSLVILVSPELINSLAVGSHELVVYFVDGGSATVKFKVTTPKKTNTTVTSPQTGEPLNVMLWGALFVTSLSGGTVALKKAIRKKDEES